LKRGEWRSLRITRPKAFGKREARVHARCLLFDDHATRFSGGKRARHGLLRTCRNYLARVARKIHKVAYTKLSLANA
jgi:hypothetical protein